MDTEMLAGKFRSALESGDMKQVGDLLREHGAPDMVQEWPQSGERMRGIENITAVGDNYQSQTGTTPTFKMRRMLKPGEAWILEGTIDYGDGVPVSMVSIVEMGAGGKISRQTDYFAYPFEPPEWRRQWVERMEPAAVGASR